MKSVSLVVSLGSTCVKGVIEVCCDDVIQCLLIITSSSHKLETYLTNRNCNDEVMVMVVVMMEPWDLVHLF